MGNPLGDSGIAGLLISLVLLTSYATCATAGGPPVAELSPNGQQTLKVKEVVTPRAATGPEANPPQAPMPAAEAAPAPEGPAAEAKPQARAKPQPAQEVAIAQQAEFVPPPAPANAPKVPGGPIRVTQVELRDVGPTVATVLLKSDKPIRKYEYLTLPDPPRLVIAIHEAIHAVPKPVEALAGGPIKNIRSFQYRRQPVQIVRVVLHLSSNLPYLPHIPSRFQAAPGALQIVIGEAVTRTAPTADAPKDHVPSPEAPAPDKSVPPPGLSKRVSVDLRQIDIRAVLKFLVEQGDLNIVAGKNLGGRVTLSLKDVTIQDALGILASTHELAYVLQGPVIHVMTEADYQRLFGSSFADQRQVKRVQLRYADAAALAAVLGNMKSKIGRVIADAQTRTIILIDVPDKLEQMVAAAESMDRATQLQTQVFELQYAKAEDVKAELEKLLTPKLGAIRLDKRTNTLVVTDLLPQMPEVRRVIHAFDRRPREVIIEAKIIELRLDDRFRMGVDWEVLFQDLADLSVKSAFPITPPLASFGKLTVGTLPQDKVTAVVQLLQTLGRANILSTPQITVVENEEAKILVGTREAFVTSVVTQTQQAATTAEEISFVDVGVKLKVLASISPDGFVTMKITPEVSSVTRTLTTATGNEIPIVETSVASTTVMVKDGTTIVIAGLMKDETVETEKKVPILGDIPILGWFFRSKDEKVVKNELIFFLTPSIISGEESVSGVGSALGKKTKKRSKEG